MRRFFSFSLAIFVFFLISCQPQKQPIDKILEKFHDANSSYVMVAAHRAGHNGYAENSIPAIQHAIDIGVDIIELDVKVTTDSVVVLNHDRTIDRTTTGTGDPESYSWDELKQFKLKMPDGTITDERLATFEEALSMVKGKAMIDIDIKTSNLKPVVDAIKRTGTENQVFFFDNDYDALKEALDRLPEALIMPRAYSYEMADSALTVFSPAVVHIDDSFYTEELCNLLRKNNARVWINALGDQDRLIKDGKSDQALDNLLKYGANIIQTDLPETIIPILKEKGLRN